jgi:hypothetical protein
VELTAHDHFFFEDTGNRLWCSAFSAVWDGPLRLQPEEVLGALPAIRTGAAGNRRKALLPGLPGRLEALSGTRVAKVA